MRSTIVNKIFSIYFLISILLATSLPILITMQMHYNKDREYGNELFASYKKYRTSSFNIDHFHGNITTTARITLITGDIVTVGITSTNKIVVLSIEPYNSKAYNRVFRIFEDSRGLYVIPSDIDLRKVDLNLFNIKMLLEEEYYKLPNIPVILKYKERYSYNTLLSHIQSVLSTEKNETISKNYTISPLVSIKISPGETFYNILSSDYIEKIWLNYRVKVSLFESAPIIGAPEVWRLGYDGSGIKIAILDTGIDYTHPHFYFPNGTSKIISQIDFTDDNDPYDYHGHGTHVASIAAGSEINFYRTTYVREYAPNEWYEEGEPMGWRADDGCWLLELPFAFPYYGNYYTRIYVSSNGLVSFTHCDRSWWNSIYELSQRLAIAPAWDDWRTDVRPGDDIYVWRPDENSIAIRWRVVHYWYYETEANFGVILYRNGTVKFIYGYSYGYLTATVGISNGAGDVLAEDLEYLNYIDTRVFKPIRQTITVRGIAPRALLMNVKVLNRWGWGYLDWVIAGVEYATLGPDGRPNTGDEADIISMSLGAYWWTDGTDPLSLVCDAAVDLGRVVVVAAGNWGDYQSIGVPATARKVITVGASDKYDYIAYFSSRGPTVDFRVKPDLVAPGVDIWAALARNSLIEYYVNISWIPGMDVDGDGRYDITRLSGTSMATPHVSGAVALIKQARQLDAYTIKDLLISTAKDLGYDIYTQGGGRLNVLAALESNLLITPATYSLGLLTANHTHAFTVTFKNIGNETIKISIYPRLTGVFSNNDYSDRVTLNTTLLSLRPGESRDVLVVINSYGLPPDHYSGIIYTNYTIHGSIVHAIFGFSKIIFVDIEFYGLDDVTAIPYAMIGVFKADAPYPSWTITYTDEDGRARIYLLEDGVYYIIGFDSGRREYCRAYAVEKVLISGASRVRLSLKNAHRISYIPPSPNHIISWLGNGILYVFQNESHWSTISYFELWYYPAVRDVYITSTDLIFSSYYQHYNIQYINVPDPIVLISPELFTYTFVNKTITRSKTISPTIDQLAIVRREYKVALTPPVSASISRNTIISSKEQPIFSIWFPGLRWIITSPKVLTEYLGWDIPQNVHIYYYVSYSKMYDQPNAWTPYFEYTGYEQYLEPGMYLIESNSHPLDTSVNINVQSYGIGLRGVLTISSDLFNNIFASQNHYFHEQLRHDYGLVVIKVNGSTVYYNYFYDYIELSTTISLPARIVVELYAYNEMYLSNSMSMRVEFFVPRGGSVSLHIPIKIELEGLYMDHTHPGGMVRGFVYKQSEMSYTTISYSIDDGLTWRPASSVVEQPDRYIFAIPTVSDTFVSLRINTVIGGANVDYIITRGFYVRRSDGVGRLRVETIPPVPTRIYIDGVVRNSWGLDWVRLPAGYYKLSFSDVPYYETPKFVEVTIWPDNITVIIPLTEPIPVYPGKTTEVKAYFKPLGSLRVETSPPVPATIYINGIPCNEWGLWVDIESGVYIIDFEPIEGFRTPPPVIVIVERGRLVHVIADYIRGETRVIYS